MSYPNVGGIEPGGNHPGRMNAALVVVALVLAFLLGRFTSRFPEQAHFPPPPPPDPPGAEDAAHAVLEQGAADGQWTTKDDEAFLASLSKLGQEGQLRQLRMLAQLVNGGKLKLPPPSDVPVPPACVHTCPEPTESPAKSPGRSLKQ